MELGLGKRTFGEGWKKTWRGVLLSLFPKSPLSKILVTVELTFLAVDECVSVGKTGCNRPIRWSLHLGSPEQETVRARRFWDLIMCSFPGPTKDQ